MALNAGSVEVRLGADVDPHGFREYDRAIERAKREKAVKAHLGGDYDPHAFKEYESALDRTRRTAQRRKDFKAALGGDYDPKAFKQYEQALDRAKAEAGRDKSFRARLRGDYQGDGFQAYGRATGRVKSQNDDLVHSSARVRTAFGTVWGRGGAAFAAAGGAYGLYTAVKTVIGAYGESQAVAAQTAQVIKSTGGVANVSAKHVDALATSISRKTGADDEAIASGANLLLTFTDIRNEAGRGNKIFDQATGLLADMSRALGQDTKSSAIQLGKALNDPIRGVTALQRVGVSFTQSQKDTIKHLVETGRKAEAQKLILRELRKEFGGSAVAYGKTLPGALDKAKVALGNVAESIGKRLAPWLQKGADYVTHLFRQFDKGKGPLAAAQRLIGEVGGKIGGFVKKVVEAATGGGRLARAWDNVKTAISDAGKTISPLVSWLGRAIPAIVKFGTSVLGSKTGLMLLHAAIGSVLGRAAGLAAVWAVGKIVSFATAIGRGIGALKALRTGITLTGATMKATPWGMLATVIGGVAGALGLFGGNQDHAKVSAQDLTDALHAEADAMRALRDTDLDKANAELQVQQANLQVESSERRVNQLRKAGKLHTLEGRQAELDLKSARLQQSRATRDAGDVEADTSRKRAEAIKTQKEAIQKAKDRVKTLGDERLKMMNMGNETAASRKKLDELKRVQASIPSMERKLKATASGAKAAGRGFDTARYSADLLRGALQRIPTRVEVRAALTGVSDFINQAYQLAQQARIPIRRRLLGGKAGPGEGGPAVIFGEGKKTEWWISQEGDRHQNVGWAIEALRALTGKDVELRRTGGRRAKGQKVPSPARANSAVIKIKRNLERAERQYGQLDRRLNLTDEIFVVDRADGSSYVDTAAVNQRASEIDQLIAFRTTNIRDQLVKYGQKLTIAQKAYQKAIDRLKKAMRHARKKSSKERYQRQLDVLVARKKEFGEAGTDLDLDVIDVELDIDELRKEKAAVKGTKAPAGPVIDTGGGGGDSDGGGGGDTTPDPDPDLQARLTQAEQRAAGFQAQLATQEAAIGAFSAPGDIGTGAASAFAAGFDAAGVGVGNPYGAANPYGGPPTAAPPGAGGGFAASAFGGLEPGVPYIVKAMPITDPAGQQQLAGAVNSGNGYQGYRGSSIEIPGL